MQEKNVKFTALGCRLNTVEAEKIKLMLESAGLSRAIIVNTCAVTAEAERQSKQAIRKLVRENPNVPLFVTGCAVTRDPETFAKIPGIYAAIVNKDKFNIQSYLPDFTIGESVGPNGSQLSLGDFTTLSKAFVQIQNGCNHACSYCIISKLRGKNVSFSYDSILTQVQALVNNGYHEIVLTGVDIAGYIIKTDAYHATTDRVTRPNITHDVNGNRPRHTLFLLGDLVRKLLDDVPGMKRMRLSSLDPAVNLGPIIDIMHENPRMLPHMHLSMQSGSNEMLGAMGRRHTVDMVRDLVQYANASGDTRQGDAPITFSWDLICGFPGETKELFAQTCDLIRELKPIHVHAFPFSPRPGTAAATMPCAVDKQTAKSRVKIVSDLARENRMAFMATQRGKTASILTEENNAARDPHDIPVRIRGASVLPKSVVDVRIVDIIGEEFIGELIV